MNYRYLEILASTALVDGQVVTIDLDMADPISELILDLQTTNAADADTDEHAVGCFPKIELIDGSDVLFSLDGFETDALDIYHSGKAPRGGNFVYLNNVTATHEVAISFGRELWDEELAFDPKHFANPQLRVTFLAGGGGMNVTAGFLTVQAALFDEKMISPIGFLMSKEIKRWIKASTGHEYVELPTDLPYRKMLIQSRYAGTPPYSIFSNIKLSSDQDKKVILNSDFDKLISGIGRENAYMEERVISRGATSPITIHVTPTSYCGLVASDWMIHADGAGVACYDGDGGRYRYWSEEAANVISQISGYAPHGTLCIPFGRQGIIADWFDVGRLGSLKLDITSGNSSATQKVFLQQFRSY